MECRNSSDQVKSDYRSRYRVGRLHHRDALDRQLHTVARCRNGGPWTPLFFGLLVLPVWYGLRNYLSDMSESGALAGALACSFIGFIMNRLVLSQKENHMLIFSLLAIVIVLNYELVRKRAPQRSADKSLRSTYLRATNIPAAGALRARPSAFRDNQGERIGQTQSLG